MVTLIRDLAVSYISQPECLILVAISMRGIRWLLSTSLMVDDIDNQSALSLAQNYDPKGIRTIGIHFHDENSDNRGAHKARYSRTGGAGGMGERHEKQFSPFASWILFD
jgi:hypothetical protein